MDIRAVLSTFDDQMRRNVRPGPGEKVERDGQVVRIIASADGWSGVVWSDLADDGADTAIAGQINRFTDLGQPWEWKLSLIHISEPTRLGMISYAVFCLKKKKKKKQKN